jgi:cell division septation protein DedD
MMSDEGVREIQLNGKQLVFMFMTVTVAAVVIFLCGVMVGRGVDTARAVSIAELPPEAGLDPTSAALTSTAPATDVTASAASTPVSTQDDLKNLTYAQRLEAPEPPPEPAVEPAVVPVPAVAGKASAPAVVVATTQKPEAPSTEPKGDGFVVQVAAVQSRSEADAIATRLSSKGFPSFVSTPGSGAPRVYRVRVGKYKDKREAEGVARRLQQEEQFKPWITR